MRISLVILCVFCLGFGAIRVTTAVAIPHAEGLAKDPVKASELNSRGVKKFEQEKYSEALSLFQKALRLDPKAKTIRTNVGHCHKAIGIQLIEGAESTRQSREYRAALGHIEQSLLYWEGDAETFHVAGYCHLRLKQPKQAMLALKKAVKKDPERFRSWRMLAVAREQLDQLPEALAALDKALALRPGETSLRLRRKRIRFDHEALSSYRRLESERFRVLYPKVVSIRVAERVRDALHDTAVELERRWGMPAPKNVTAICYPPGEFSARTGLHEEVGGAFDGRIRLSFPEDLEAGGLGLGQVVRHEVVHLFLHSLPQLPPRWIDEGLAQLIDGDPRKNWEPRFQSLLKEDSKTTLPERELRYREDMPTTWGALYIHAFFFFQHLEDRYKSFRLDMLVQQVRAGKSWEKSFEGVFGKSAEELDRSWRRALLLKK